MIVAIHVKDIDDGVGSTHEVRMVRVDVGVLDLDQVAHLRLCGTQLLRKQLVHAVDNLLAQVLEALQFMHLNLNDDTAELFVDELHTLERG